MSPELKSMLLKGDEKGIENFVYGGLCPDFFGVNWRAGDDEIVLECAACLKLEDSLSAEWIGDKLFITFEGGQTLVPLLEDGGDRHITICKLNDVLEGKYQLRFIVVSLGNDSIGIVALTTEDWAFLQAACPQTVIENFIDPRSLPNLITEITEEHLPVPARARYLRMINRNQKFKT